MFCLGLIILIFAVQIDPIDGTHFRGGIISWRALNTTPSGLTAKILIHQRYAWRRSFFNSTVIYPCNDTSIVGGKIVGSGTGILECFGGFCANFSDISADVYCTDFSLSTDYSLGERFTTYSLLLNSTFVVGFTSNAWLPLVLKGNGIWTVTGKIDLKLRPDGIINTSPVTSTLPVIYRAINVQHVHVVQMSDADSTDTLRCRWSTGTNNTNTNYNDECGSVCSPTLPTFALYPDNCTLTYRLNIVGYYAVALQIEDFYNSTTTPPMSSVPIQFLFYGIIPPGGCSTPPSITGVRPNLACIGTPIGSLTNETVIAQVGCSGKTIKEFTTSSPTGLIKTAILNPSTGVYTINLLFTPTATQYGPQGFCAGAIDNTNVQSDPWCITFLVGFSAPDLQVPLFVQGSASPLGTVFANHSIFSIQSKNGVYVNRPGHNATYFSFHDATLNGSIVLQYDCGWSPNVVYIGSTIIVYTSFTWTYGHRYYITLDSGASSGNDFCHAESAPITDPTFWQFDIWNPGLSSTTSTTTTPPTTGTVTTRPLGTTTTIANLTTTGIVLTTPQTQTTTTQTTTTTTQSTTVTTVITASTTTTYPSVSVMTPKDFEESCKQPLIIGTVLSMSAMIPIHFIGMFTLFTKINQKFNPNRVAVLARQNKRFAARK